MPIKGGSDSSTAARITASPAAMAQSAPAKPSTSSSSPPRKKPTPFIAFLLPVKKATQRNNCPEAAPPEAAAWVSLMADLLAVLVRSLATPQMPCASTTQATEKAALQPGDMAESKRKPRICVQSPTASMRAMPKRVASQPPTRLAPIPAAS